MAQREQTWEQRTTTIWRSENKHGSNAQLRSGAASRVLVAVISALWLPHQLRRGRRRRNQHRNRGRRRRLSHKHTHTHARTHTHTHACTQTDHSRDTRIIHAHTHTHTHACMRHSTCDDVSVRLHRMCRIVRVYLHRARAYLLCLIWIVCIVHMCLLCVCVCVCASCVYVCVYWHLCVYVCVARAPSHAICMKGSQLKCLV